MEDAKGRGHARLPSLFSAPFQTRSRPHLWKIGVKTPLGRTGFSHLALHNRHTGFRSLITWV